MPQAGTYQEIFNSDSTEFGGTGFGNEGDIVSEPIADCGYENSIVITVPPLGACFYRMTAAAEVAEAAAEEIPAEDAAPAGEAPAEEAPAKDAPAADAPADEQTA